MGGVSIRSSVMTQTAQETWMCLCAQNRVERHDPISCFTACEVVKDCTTVVLPKLLSEVSL
jgi:hypothetical protein